MSENKTEVFKPNEIEIMHYVLLWCYNWTQEDFKKAFATSHLGWDYYWDKLQGKIKNDKDPSAAILEVVLNMDDFHQQLLFDFLFTDHYPDEILKARKWKNIMDSAKEKAKKKREAKENN